MAGLFLPKEHCTLYWQGMQALMQADYAVTEFYDHGKSWKEDFVKFTDFDEQSRVAAITYTPFPAEHRDALLERVRDACQPFGKDLTGKLVNVVVGFKNPNRN
jgi:hypothetical protein